MSKRPTIYDFSTDERRPATQADIDLLIARLGEASDLKQSLLRVLGLPPNAAQQIARVKELGGFYRLSKFAAENEGVDG